MLNKNILRIKYDPFFEMSSILLSFRIYFHH